MYAGKRFAYSPPVYKTRTLLAAIDYNHQTTDLQLATVKETRYTGGTTTRNLRTGVSTLQRKQSSTVTFHNCRKPLFRSECRVELDFPGHRLSDQVIRDF